MKYVCLFYGEEQKLDALTGPENEALQIGTTSYDRELMGAGYLLLAQPLQSTREAKSVRVRRRKAMVTDGPFAETKEQLLGFILIDVPDQQTAVEIAARSPLAALGTAEVRPAMLCPGFD